VNRLKTVVQEQALNEDAMLHRIRSKQHVIHKEESFMSMKRLLPIGLAAALVIAVIASWSFFVPGVTAPVTTGTAAEKPASTPYAMVAIDINPSFEIYIDSEENGYAVLAIHATNKDAKELYEANKKVLDDLMGGTKEDAIEAIIQLARDNDFLDEDSSDAENGKYVLVTTAILDADEDGEEDEEEELDLEDKDEAERNQEAIGYQIQLALQEALAKDPDGTVKVAVIKATLREVKFAEKDKIPLGLFIIKGMMTDSDGDGVVETGEEPIKVSDFVKNDKNVEALAKRAIILERKSDRDEIKESRKAENEADESEEPEEDEDSGKPDSVPPVTPPGQAKKETVASGS